MTSEVCFSTLFELQESSHILLNGSEAISEIVRDKGLV